MIISYYTHKLNKYFSMKISVCQIATKAGHIELNFKTIKNQYLKAQKNGADLCLFPELSTSGYLAEDLFLNSSFVNTVQQKVHHLIRETGKTCLIIPTPILDNEKLYNGAINTINGKIIGTTYKQELANHGIFDEKRYFSSGTPKIIKIDGIKIGIPICEDIWVPSVCKNLKEQGAKLLVVPNGSPFEKGKLEMRLQKVKQRFEETKLPIIYCNQAHSQDGIVFDGRSFCFDGTMNIIGKAFEPSSTIVEFKNKKFYPYKNYNSNIPPMEEIYKAMVVGVKNYVLDNRFDKVVLGLSGGIDSAIVATIATAALGSKNVSAYMLPSKFTSLSSKEDALIVAKNLNINLTTIEINDIVDNFSNVLNIKKTTITYQNLQSRIRGTVLMAESNRNGALLLTTGNKSEYATGYATIYGDMNGAFNPIKDVYKTELYQIAHYINSIKKTFSKRILTKPPSAELDFNQKDSDSLPGYHILDKILEQYIEFAKSKEELFENFDQKTVRQVIKLVKNSEFKRKQAAPGVKISTKNFEKERRLPITNFFL